MEKSAEKRQLAIQALTERPANSLFSEPIEYILADHFRQRVLCTTLDEIAETKAPDKVLSRHVLDFMTRDFHLHVLDEEEDLFPLLRRRAKPKDGINQILGELSAEHASDKNDCSEICDLLAKRRFKPEEWRRRLKRFAANERHHLIVENAIVLPLARVRLTDRDMSNLGRRMAARRGVDYPEAPRTQEAS